MSISAKDVARLRKMTDAPMMDCKTALTECEGDFEAAKDWLRKRGLKQADKKADRDTNQGLVGYAFWPGGIGVSIAEVNCETDFVARNEKFHELVDIIANDCQKGIEVDLARYIGTLGENLSIGGRAIMEGSKDNIAIYVHGKVNETMGSMVVAVKYVGGNSEAAYNVAMHIAATAPKAVSVSDLDQKWVAKEKAFQIEQAVESGKPQDIAEKMVAGRMQKTLKEVVLMSQPFVMDATKTIEDVANEAGITITAFVRIKVGE